MFAYTNGAYKPWGDYLVEIDVGIWEQQLDDESWSAWVDCKREITEVTLKYGGSISACHGASREGDVDYVPALMQTVRQDDMPAWDTQRIVAHRWDHLDWMHDHWADAILSGEELAE